MSKHNGTHWSTRLFAAFLAFVMLLGNVPVNVFATEITGEEVQDTTVPETGVPGSGETEAEVAAETGSVHTHEYTSMVTAPTCTEQGYTTYTCECGDKYVADYVEVQDHTYKNGICTGCGSSVPDGNYTHAIPENQGVQNAIDRAYSLTDVEWTPLADVPGVKKINGEFTVVPFEAGKTYRGIPYSGVTANDCYVGLNVSLESFLTALKNKKSVLYTENLFSTNPKSATYFGTVCSKFAQYALDIPGSYNTNNIANIPGMETIALPGKYTVDQIKLGDVVLHTQNHTTVCTDILYDAEGNVAFIEISEAVQPLCRRMYWSPEEFYEHFEGYRLCRYQYIDQTPAIGETELTDDYALMPRFGDKYNYKVSSTKGTVDVLESGYHKAVILRDGVIIDEIVLGGATSFKFDRSVPGYLEMYLEKQNGTRSGSVYACVVKSSVTVTNTSLFTQGNLTVTIDGSCGTPVYVQVGSAHAIFCNVEGKSGTVEISFPFSKVSSKQVRVAYQNEYGIYLSDWSGFTTAPNTSQDAYLSQGGYWDGYTLTPSSHTPVVQSGKTGYWTYTMIPVEENATYYSKGCNRMWFLDAKGNPITTFNANTESDVRFQFTTPEGTAYVSITYAPSGVDKGTESIQHIHTYTDGTCTGCGEAQPGPVITKQPTDGKAKMGESFCVTVEAEGEGLKYQWYVKEAGTTTWIKSSITDNTYDSVMNAQRAGRQIYCVITDANGKSVTTDTVQLVLLPAEPTYIWDQWTQPVTMTAGTYPTYGGSSTGYYSKGQTFGGILYSSTIRDGRDVLWNLNSSTYYSAVANPASLLYTTDYRGRVFNESAWAGSVCNTTALKACGYAYPYTTTEIPMKFDEKTDHGIDNLEFGDILWTKGHVAGVIGVTTGNDGHVASVKIIEQASYVKVFEITAQNWDTYFSGHWTHIYRGDFDETKTAPEDYPENLSIIFERGNNTYVTDTSKMLFYIPTATTVYVTKDGVTASYAKDSFPTRTVIGVTVYDLASAVTGIGDYYFHTEENTTDICIKVINKGSITISGATATLSGYENCEILGYRVIQILDEAKSSSFNFFEAPEGYTSEAVPLTFRWYDGDTFEIENIPADAAGWKLEVYYDTGYGWARMLSSDIIYGEETHTHTYENGICTGCGAAQWDTDGDGTLEILAIGNSFSVDALEYAYQIAQDLGIEKIAIGNLYIGGCSLETHAKNAAGDFGKYTYYHNDSGKWTSTSGTKISTALAERDWDFITLQQWSATSGVESSYNDDLTYLIGYVKERSEAKIGWHMTWAYQQNSTHSSFPTYGSDQMTMYNAIVSAVKNKILTNENMDFVIPSGTAVQNSRTSLLGDTTTRDGYHMSYDYGRYLTGLMWFRELTGLSVDAITYAPSGVDSEEKAIAVESVNHAFEKPFEVTKSEFTNEIPEGYILLEPELYKGAFWHCTFAEGYNVLHDDKSNSHQFFATPRFTESELPVGSIIVVESGWQYRPEGWVTDALQTEREDVTAKSFVKVTEEWWGDYTIRAFNISKIGLPSLENTEEAEVRAAFRIYVPEEKHTHTYENGICILCGAEMEAPVWEQGTIAYATGLNRDDTTRIRTAGYLKLEDYAAVTVNSGYMLVRFVYDQDYKLLSGTDWLGDGIGFSVDGLKAQFPKGVYFRVALCAKDNRVLTPDDVAASGIAFLTEAPEIEMPLWEQGTIASADGTNNSNASRFRTAAYHRLSDYSGVGINTGYTMTNFVYDENYTYLGTSSWLGSGIPFTTAALQEKYPTGVYFRVVFRADDQRNLTEADVAASGVKFYLPGEEIPTPEFNYSYENIASIGSWQDGAIWDGKLFALGAAGTGAVFDVKTGAKLGSIQLDGADVLKPHANSVCFGSTYYAAGDDYPLLYVNIYNNYASVADRMEGTCCVYQVTEKNNQFATELVQVIKIGFTEDLNLWKSKENNGDVRPYGNFVVDTDEDVLYAFVMRDANKTTRFFAFDIPTIGEGVYNESYGCNVVTLETGDIKNRFDIEHHKYLQGCSYHGGKILYVGDFGGDAPLLVVDLKSQKVTEVFSLGHLGLKAEPEVICADPADGTVYYAAADGMLRKLTLPVKFEAPKTFAGKTISILGDSISTYTGISNNASYNATLSGGAIYYTAGRLGVYQKDTWWQQAIDALGMELLVNNSWSGSCVFSTRSGTVGAYIDRAVQLHNIAGEEPDIVAVYLGTNDFGNYKSTLGTAAAIDYDRLITKDSGTYSYANPATAAEAYAIMLHKAMVRYPDAEFYCFTLLPQRNLSAANQTLMIQFNESIAAIAAHFGAYVVDLYNKAGIKADKNFQFYVADNSLHPGPAGMDAITGCFTSALYKNSSYAGDVVYDISYELTDVIVDQGTAYAIQRGDHFSCSFTAPAGYELTVSVTMGDEDITESVYADGKLVIEAVNGELNITACSKMPEKDPENYRWVFDGMDLSNVSAGMNAENTITRLSGSVTDGVHKGSRFQLSKDVVLYHDRPWAIEWKSEGTWTDATDGALLFAGATSSSTNDVPYLYRRHKSDFIALGVYTGGKYHNYGVALGSHGIDATAEHTYRLENHIEANGSNMVYLYVDGNKVGPMNHHWIGGTDQKETVDWVNGQDFVFSYMGTNPHAIGGCSIDYIQVWENGQPSFEGKTVSILGDSISTYAGISNNTSYNSTLGKNIGFYPVNDVTAQSQTWWQQVIDLLGMKLLVNNSSGGGRILSDEKLSIVTNGTFSSNPRNVAAYKERCVNLHNANGENPDVILVFLGTNDFSYHLDPDNCEICKTLAACTVCNGSNTCKTCVTNSGLSPSFCPQDLGTADIRENLIAQNQDGTYAYLTPETTCEAYAILLHKMQQKYPDAEIYCMGLLARRDPDYAGGYHDHGQPTAFNSEMKELVERFGATFIDLENCGISKDASVFDQYIYDKAVHPNAAGMDKITEAVVCAMLGGSVQTYEISANLTNATLEGVRLAVSGSAYTAKLTPDSGYTDLDVTVTMGGRDITESVYADGVITIPAVTGAVTITASAMERDPKNFRWEFDGSGLVSKGKDDNSLKKLAGSVTDGFFSNARYQLEDAIILRHDRPWILEWKGEGSGGFMLAREGKTNDGNKYFFHRSNNTLEAFGYWKQEESMNHNYGVSLQNVIDTGSHKYRLENRIGSDGTNMVYLIVDDRNEYRMDRLFFGGAAQGTTGDWISGKDFVFNHIGTTELPLTNYKLDYLQVWENGQPSLAGKTISILGASISTYAGTSNGAAADTTNSTIRNNAQYYPHSVVTDVKLNDTWWMQVTEDLGLRLLVNNSWSGSALLHERNGTKGAYVDRCVQLHDDTGDNAGEMPDIIAIQMGSNDFQYYKDTLGTADIDYAALIKKNADGTFTYATPVTSLEAAAIVLHKISVRYTDAEVYYLNVSQRIDGTDELIRFFNGELKQVVEHFGAHIVDIYGSGITMENFETYIGDGRVHPNRLGMDAYTEAFKKALLENTGYSVSTHLVTLDLTDVTADYGTNKTVVSGDAFRVKLTAAAGKELSVTVTMGGEDITASAYSDGTVAIDAVIGDVVITAVGAEHQPKDYRWEFDGTDLVSVGETANALTKNAGTTTDGVFSNTRYALEKAVVLSHDRNWIVEWKSEGTFKNSGTSTGARIFTSTDVNAEYNARSIFKSATNWLVTMGEKDTKGSHNYGIALADHGIDGSAPHTYRLENRIADDGSNMVWLFVDGAEIGPMNNYYIGTTSQKTTSDWLSGKDFVFPYMGTDTHGFTNASIEYIQIYESHTHSYETVMTPPTCTEQGYTTHTCECGDSYVDSYVDAVGHSWVNGVCTLCGATKKPYQRLTYFTVDVQSGDGKSYTDNAVLYLPNTYSPNGEPVKLVIYCKQGSSQITSASNPIESVGFYNYLISLGYAVLGVDGVPDAWRDELGLDNTRVVGNPMAVQGTEKAYDYVIDNYNIAADGCFISGYSQGGHYAQNVIDLTDIPILAAAEQSPVCSMRYHQWDLNASQTVGGVKFTKAARLNVARIYGFPAVATNAELLNLAYDASLVAEYDPWVRNSQNIYTGFVQKSNLWYLPEGTNLDDITMTHTAKCPVKIWCAEDDTAISADVMKVFVKAIQNAGGIAEISVAPSGGHGFFQKQTAVGTFTENGKTYKTLPIAVEIAQWFARFGGYECQHDYTSVVTAPTCTEQGYTTHTCIICGDKHVDSYVDATGHTWGEWVVEKEAQMEASGLKARSCATCGEREETAIPALQEAYPDILHGHLQAIPNGVFAHTNLWPLLEPESEYFYAGTHWGALDNVVSVTIPVSPGDQIYASSFKRGIRVAFFGTDGLLISLSNTEIKAEFEEHGYITAPEGAVAVNIPMWDNSEDNVLRILTLERIECQKHVFTQQETIAQPGLVSKGTAVRYCENCGFTETIEIPELMQAGGYAYQDDETSIVLPYRIYYPSSYDYESGTQTQYPIVIFYHGAGSRGSDNQSQVLGKAIIDRIVKLDNCIILAPQCNTGYQWVNTPWSNGSYDSTSVRKSIYLDASVALLDEMILNENVDEERVYAIGLSMGGYATWNVMMEYPEKFAAVIPICGAADPSRANEVLGIAVWAFHGDKDATVPVSGSREMIEAIRALGGIDVKYTEYAGVGHDSWVKAFAEPELTDWLFSQKKHIHSHEAVITDPTCSDKGFTTHTCHCGDSYVDSYVDATGHKFGDWEVVNEPTCTEKGEERRDCDNCDHFETREIAAAGHDYEAVVTKPTCTERGFTTHTCHCGDSYVDSYVDAVGHKFGNWAVTTEPSCTEKGEERRDCANCDHFETREVEAIGHDYEAVVTAPTCVEKGYTTHTCHCGDSYIDSYVEAIGHKFGDWEVVNEPTCTEKGMERRDCEDCDHFETREVAAIGHDYEAVVTKPTCSDKGFTTHTCHCGDSYIDSYVDAVGHKFGDWTVTTEPTCTKIGEERRDCENCDHFETREIAATGHDYEAVVTEPTCVDKGYTTHTCHCGDSYIDSYVDAVGHKFGDWEIVEGPTCTEKGEERRDCTNCDHFETREVVATGHDYEAVATAPTCTEKGFTTHTCHCGDSYTDSYVDAVGHKFGNWTVTTEPTCTDKGMERRDCANCDHFETREVEAIGHDYEAVVTAPTCVDKGYTTHTCHCGDSYVDSYVEATGHKFGEWEVVNEPTCTEKGAERRDCENCDHFETREVEAMGHDYEAVVTKPACVDKGYTTHTCSKCGDSYTDSYVDAVGHKFGEWMVTIQPTCTEKGMERRDCVNCDYFESREVNAAGHGYDAVVTNPTCVDRGYTTHTCSNCGDSYVDSYVNVLGHEYGEWYVTKQATLESEGEERRDCDRCDDFQTRKIPKLVHNYTSVVTAPTCTEQGYTTHTCQNCGDEYVDTYVNALGHNFVDYVSNDDATCTVDGTKTAECERCDETDTIRDAGTAKGHEFGDWTVTIEPTCTENGKERRDCDNCDHFEIREVGATGHDYETVVTKPTCVDKGYTTHTCSNCGDSYVDSYVNALGHKYENGSCTVCGEPEVKYLPGDVDLDGDVDVDDVLALLWYVLFPEDYPIEVDADFDRNGSTDVDDVLALLWYVLFPEDYPLN